jgi:phosphatidylglycerol:prolipoprotein diacylglycerol transferase
MVDGFLAAATGGLIVGRVSYVAVNWTYYQEQSQEIYALWRGGQSFLGAFCGGALALAGYVALRSRRTAGFPPVAEVFELAGQATSLAGILGWLATLAGGVAYGALGSGPLHFLLPDIYGIQAQRFATQPLGALLSLVVFVLLLILERAGSQPGRRFGLFMFLYFGGLAILEALRGDETIFLGDWRIGQVVSAGLALLGLILIFAAGSASQRREVAPTPADATLSDDRPEPPTPQTPGADRPAEDSRAMTPSHQADVAGEDEPDGR